MVVAVDPTLAADRAVRTNVNAAIRAGRNVPHDVGVSNIHRVGQTGIGRNVTVVLRFGRVIESIGAVIRVGGIKTVGRNVVSFQVDGVLRHHAFGEDKI